MGDQGVRNIKNQGEIFSPNQINQVIFNDPDVEMIRTDLVTDVVHTSSALNSKRELKSSRKDVFVSNKHIDRVGDLFIDVFEDWLQWVVNTLDLDVLELVSKFFEKIEKIRFYVRYCCCEHIEIVRK